MEGLVRSLDRSANGFGQARANRNVASVPRVVGSEIRRRD